MQKIKLVFASAMLGSVTIILQHEAPYVGTHPCTLVRNLDWKFTKVF